MPPRSPPPHPGAHRPAPRRCSGTTPSGNPGAPQAPQSTSSSSPRSERSFFRPMARNDGTLAPASPRRLTSRRWWAKRTDPGQANGPARGRISMSRLEISGHVRAGDRAEGRTAQEGRLRIKTANARHPSRGCGRSDPIRPRVVGENARHGRGDGGRTDAGTKTQTWKIRSDRRAPPGSMLKVKRTREERAADDEHAKRGAS